MKAEQSGRISISRAIYAKSLIVIDTKVIKRSRRENMLLTVCQNVQHVDKVSRFSNRL